MKTLPLFCAGSLSLCLLPSLHAAAAETAPAPSQVPASVLDLAMQPSELITNPGPKYSAEQRDYAMVIGMDRTPKGRIWSAWVAGGDSDLGYFVLASSDDDGATWSKPRLVIDPPEAPTGLRKRILVGNLWTDPTGKLWLFYDQSMGYYDGRAGVWAITCENPDAENPTWSEPRRIWHGLTLNKPIVLKNGEWLLPISLWTRDRIGPAELRDGFKELDEFRMANIFVSTDQGKTWNRRGGVAVPETDFDEHMFVELKDGRLWLMARTKYGIAESFSSDQGRTWTAAQPSTIQNVSSRFFFRRLASGNLLLVKNGPLNERLKGRSHMTAYLSDDEGKSWKGGLIIDERGGVSYPDGFQAPDGTIYITHDHNRDEDREILFAKFKEEDVLAGKFTVPGSAGMLMVSKALGKNIGEITYNGIQLDSEWPPRTQDPKSTEPMAVPYLTNPPAVIPINFGRQLFVDDFLIEQTDLKRTYHAAEKYSGNPVFKAETPEENKPSTIGETGQEAVCYLGHGGVFFDPKEKHFKMFYTAGWRGGLAQATSQDLLHWDRPNLGLVGGNVILPGGKQWAGGDNSVWLDLSSKLPEERYKLLTDRQPHTIHTSPDGRIWSQGIPTGKAGDYCSFFYNPFRKKWVYSIKQGGPRGRSRYYAETSDFLKGADWKNSVYWTNADQLDPEDPEIGEAPQLYSLNAVAYESLMLGEFYILQGPNNEICDKGKFPKVTQVMLGFSRDGFHWHRPERRPFIAATKKEGDWDRAYIHGTTGVMVVKDDRLYFPYTGYSGIAPSGTRGMYTGASIGLATLRRDGFASMGAGATTGTLTTRPVAFNGAHLFVNVNAPQGSLKAEVLNEAGKVIEPYTVGNCEAIKADSTRTRVQWKGTADLESVRGKAVRLRFHLTNGQLYSFWTTSHLSGASGGYIGSGGPGFPGVVDTVGDGSQAAK
ncbi:sialidase family protein [Verrucomicrobium spinosum]|uniref:sialidase family protein n=1 Tax=Verrucomicrobium spinosum TaxID=2736 RepID=UPI00017446D3|nr:sialidase family protein [Verrucomicrobium spinosum]